jgi:anti-sigma factor RsiW
MTCHDAREQLSALLDDALAASELEVVEAHLAMCSECRRELARLRGTVTLLGHLPPVHAPAGFVDRVMAETSRSSWRHRLLRALFLPLRVKLPLEAAALVLIGVSALYVHQHTPEIRQLARQVPGESSSDPHAAPSMRPTFPASPPVSATAGRTASSKDRELDTKRGPVAPERAREESRRASPTTPPPATSAQPGSAAHGSAFQEAPAAKLEKGPEATSQPTPELKKESQADGRPDTLGATPSSAETEGATQDTGSPLARDAVAGRPRASGPVGTVPTETGDAIAAVESRHPGRMVGAIDASGRLAVLAREPAEIAIDALLRRVGATRVARRLEGEHHRVVIDVLVPGARYPELVEGLGRIGRWVADHEPRDFPAEVRVEVALTVEP